jgi:hypothetical protein
MAKLCSAMQNVAYSQQFLQTNIFYNAFCQAKLMEVFCELNLFKLYNASKDKYKKLNHKLDNFVENA